MSPLGVVVNVTDRWGTGEGFSDNFVEYYYLAFRKDPHPPLFLMFINDHSLFIFAKCDHTHNCMML